MSEKCKICNGSGILEIEDDSEYDEGFCDCDNCKGTGEATMAKMTMIETGELKIVWKCSKCGSILKDRNGFEKLKNCPSCGIQIDKFISLYDD